MKDKNVAILGYGVVGSGVFDILNSNLENISNKIGKKISVKKILDLRDFIGDPAENLITHDFDDVLNDKDIDVVVETMGGVNPAFQFVKSLLQNGKSVVTSNKELVAKHGAELLKTAIENDVKFLFEASVGGGVPIIRSLTDSLVSDEITEIFGILNGTTNYILSQMANHSIDLQSALKTAQELGYAEKDPSADVEGLDTCRKLAILLSIIVGKQINSDKIYTEGIKKITELDINVAKTYDSIIKLVAIGKVAVGKIDGNEISARVSPVVIPNGNPIGIADSVFNAIMLRGKFVGDVMLYGKGAGKYPTASAVVADVIDILQNDNIPTTPLWIENEQNLIPFENMISKKLIIASYNNKNDVIEGIKTIFDADCKFHDDNIISFITKEMTEKELALKINNLATHNGIDSIISDIRVC